MVEILVEHPWQRTMVGLIPNLDSSLITVAPMGTDFQDMIKSDLKIVAPDVYRVQNSFNAGWERLRQFTTPPLTKKPFPGDAFDLVVMYKSKSFSHKTEGRNIDSHRFVSEEKYEAVIYRLADQGWRIVRLGGPEQRALKKHANILDLAGTDRSLDLDVRAISSSRVGWFSDSGLWPIAVGLGVPSVISDIVSDQGSYFTHRLLPFLGVRIGYQSTRVFGWVSPEHITLHKRRFTLFRLSIFIPNSRSAITESIEGLLKSA